LLSGIRALLAARLLTLMFVGFGPFVWLPQPFSTCRAIGPDVMLTRRPGGGRGH